MTIQAKQYSFEFQIKYIENQEDLIRYYHDLNQFNPITYAIIKFFLILKELQDQDLIREYVTCNSDIYKLKDSVRSLVINDWEIDQILDESEFNRETKEKLRSFIHAVQNHKS